MSIKILFLSYCFVLVYYGFLTHKPSWLGWFMFVRGSFCYAELTSEKVKINIWDYLPHCQVIVHMATVVNLLTYLRVSKGMTNINGHFILYTPKKAKKYFVKKSYVVLF